MLVLSRRQSETIVIGDCIRVQVLEISGGRVRLAIEAPSNVSVDREEIWERKRVERMVVTQMNATPNTNGKNRMVRARV